MDNESALPQRTRARAGTRDYRQNGVYSITVISKQRHELFGKVQGGKVELSECGRIVASHLEKFETIYPSVMLDAYVIMPDHVHVLLILMDDKRNPSVQRVVHQWKGAASKEAGFALWQDGFHDRLVLDAKEYRRLKRYIQSNPANWKDDPYAAIL